MFVEGPRTSWSGGGPTEVKALSVGQAGGGEHGSGSGFDAGPCRLFTQFARGGREVGSGLDAGLTGWDVPPLLRLGGDAACRARSQPETTESVGQAHAGVTGVRLSAVALSSG